MALFRNMLVFGGCTFFCCWHVLYMVLKQIHHVSSISRLSRLIHEYLCQSFTYVFCCCASLWRFNRPVSAPSRGPTTDKGCQMKFWQLLLCVFIYAKLHNTWLFVRENHPKRGVLLLRTQIRFAQASRSMKSISNRCFFHFVRFYVLVLSGYIP